MHRYQVHSKAPDNFRNSPEFLRYVRWEEKQYPSSKYPEERTRHAPNEGEIAFYHKVTDRLRLWLRDLDKVQYSKQKQARTDFLYKLIELNQQHISHLRDPSIPDRQRKHTIPGIYLKEKPLVEEHSQAFEKAHVAITLPKQAGVPVFWLPMLEQSINPLPARSLQRA